MSLSRNSVNHYIMKFLIVHGGLGFPLSGPCSYVPWLLMSLFPSTPFLFFSLDTRTQAFISLHWFVFPSPNSGSYLDSSGGLEIIENQRLAARPLVTLSPRICRSFIPLIMFSPRNTLSLYVWVQGRFGLSHRAWFIPIWLFAINDRSVRT